MSDWKPTGALASTICDLGFRYEPEQNIIVSRHGAWQRYVGFTWAYDVLAPAMAMIIDCEPIYFTCDGRDWMIELWKGQYGLETGAEIGVYVTAANPPAAQSVLDALSSWLPAVGRAVTGVEKSVEFFACVSPQDELEMQFTLKRKGIVLIHRGPERHWWLTGFRWGEYTERTSDLVMDVRIAFRRPEMGKAFRGGLQRLGYTGVVTDGMTVGFTFGVPKTTQPPTRTTMETAVQAANKALVDRYVALQQELGLLTDDPAHSNDPNRFDPSRIASEAGREAYHRVEAFLDLIRKGRDQYTRIWRQHGSGAAPAVHGNGGADGCA